MIYCISIRQPWITQILTGDKPIEYRQWRSAPKLRGWIALHASLKVDWECVDDADLDLVWPIGGILGIAYLSHAYLAAPKQVNIHFTSCHWLPEPIRYKGRLGFFPVTGDALKSLQRQVKKLGVKL